MKDLELIKQALEKANQRGVYTLEESAIIFNAIQTHERFIINITSQLDNNNNAKKESPVKNGKGKSRKN